MISSEQDAPGSHSTDPGTQVILGEQAYSTIMQAAPSGESTGLLLGDPALQGGPIAVRAAIKLGLSSKGTGFLLDTQALGKIAELTAAGQSAHVLGWFYASSDLAASSPRISFPDLQAMLPAGANLLALANPAANTGAFYTWDSTQYHHAAMQPGASLSVTWTHEPEGAALALDDLLYGETPASAPVPEVPAPVALPAEITTQAPPEQIGAPPQVERPTSPIPIGAQTAPTRMGETVPLPAFLRRKYNLEVLRLKSTWPEWAHQAGMSPGGALSTLRHNTAVLFTGQANRRIAFTTLGALLSIVIGSTLVYAGLHSSGSSTPSTTLATPTATTSIPVVVIEPTASATQPEVVAATSTPPAMPTLVILPDTETPTIEPTSTPADTNTPTPIPTEPPTRVPTRRPVPPTNTSPEPPPTEIVEPTATSEPIIVPTDTVEEPTSTPIEPTATFEPLPTETPAGTPEPTHRPTPMPGLLTPTPELPTPTAIPVPTIFTPEPVPPTLEPPTPTLEP